MKRITLTDPASTRGAAVHYQAPELAVSEWFNTPAPISLASLIGRPVFLHTFQALCPGCVGMVFQLFHLWPHLSVLENVAIAARKVRRLPAAEARELAMEMLAKVHMSHRAAASPLELSGGQQQRVAIARALAQKPKLMLFDEPTSALDPELVHEVLKVIEELASEGRTMLLVTHEIAFARDVADRVMFLDGGVIVEEGAARDVILAPREPRAQAFLKQIRH